MCKIWIWAIILILSGLLFSCNSKKESSSGWNGEIKTKNGVTYVKNPDTPFYGDAAVSLVEEMTIGNKGDEKYIFTNISDLAVDSEDNIYVLDTRKAHIKVFNPEGIYIRTIGQKGQGPGELRFPTGIQLLFREIMIYDYGLRKLFFFTREGQFLTQAKTTDLFRFYKIKKDEHGNYYGYTGGFRREMHLKKFNSKFETLAVIDVLRFSEEEPPDSIYFVLTEQNRLIWANSQHYDIHILDEEGNLTRKITKECKPLKISEQYKENILKNRKNSESSEIPPPPLPVFAKNFPFIMSLESDEIGRIYVGTYHKPENGQGNFFDIFDPEGKYIAKIPLNSERTSPLVWKKNKLYMRKVTEDGNIVVKRYTLKWEI